MSDVLTEDTSKQAALRCLDEYLAAWDARDAIALAASLNTPALMLGRGRGVAITDPAEQAGAMLEQMVATGWHHSTWLRREMLHCDEDKVHFDVRFCRYREDGSILGTFAGVYIVTRNHQHWGVQMVSAVEQASQG